MTAPHPGEIEVEDQLERRIRKPVDLVRCVLACIEIVVLAVAGIAASATTAGVETDIADASRRLPHALLVVVSPLALFALLVLPVAMAVQLLVRRQFRRLAEAVATGVLAAAVTAVASALLTRPAAAASRQPPAASRQPPAASRLYYAIIMARAGTSHAAAFDPYLAGLVAYATMVGLAGRPYWRNALGAAVAVYAIVHVAALHTSVLTLLITMIGGRAIGLAVRYVAGSASQRPGALEIAGALAAVGLPVAVIRRVRRRGPRQGNPSRRYAVTEPDGGGQDVVVYDRDQQAAGALPAVPQGAGARAGVTQRPAVGGPRGGAPGPAVLCGRGGGRAHASAARRGPGRSRSGRAGLRAPRGDGAGPAESRRQRRRAQPGLGCGRPGCTLARSRTAA